MRKISVGFDNMLEATKAVEALKNMGYKQAYLDITESFYDEFSEEINFAGSTNAPSLSALVLKSNGHIYNIGKASLIAADPMVSGMGSYKEIQDDAHTRLFVNVDDEKVDDVKGILRSFGGNI
ncbi:MAG: hypothetical protein N3B21_03670 [Clostridia bacterium]|nr:hypothetical protein [Clostridia bacterium]